MDVDGGDEVDAVVLADGLVDAEVRLVRLVDDAPHLRVAQRLAVLGPGHLRRRLALDVRLELDRLPDPESI